MYFDLWKGKRHQCIVDRIAVMCECTRINNKPLCSIKIRILKPVNDRSFMIALEYFNGTMFLTSNRADDIDPAFMSRILQCIKFVSLTEDERATVWKGLVAKQGVTLTDEQASILAKFNVNGRQIKNVIKVAIALSLGAKKDLSFDTINDTAASMHSGKTLTNKGFEK